MTTPPADRLILCYDGSENAKHAIQRVAALCGGARALVLTVWQPTSGLASLAWSDPTAAMIDFAELDRAAAEDGGTIAAEGVGIAREAGMEAEPVAIAATGPVWETIIEIADRYQAAMIVMGSRGLTGLRSMLLGSVSNAVVHHAHQPILVIHRRTDDAGAESLGGSLNCRKTLLPLFTRGVGGYSVSDGSGKDLPSRRPIAKVAAASQNARSLLAQTPMPPVAVPVPNAVRMRGGTPRPHP
jgi:nucleotide-binding universal stress UspA family protein